MAIRQAPLEPLARSASGRERMVYLNWFLFA